VEAKISWRGEVCFDALTSSGHALTLDGPPDAGGKDRGPRPMEMVLLGVGGCAAYDVVHILKRGRVEVTDCVATLTAERAPDPPRVFTRIQMHFVVTGPGLPEAKVARAVKLSAEKYCSASIMLARGGVAIAHSYETIDSTQR
jgi:putative redox protein